MTMALGGYDATIEGPRLIIHDVPIFCACEREAADGSLRVFDAQWVMAAVEAAQSKAVRESYLPPLHVYHHHNPDGDPVKPAGFFQVKRAGPLELDGVVRLAAFADLVITDAAVQADVITTKYPYRSVEIFEPDGEPKIDSLALLDHRPPYLTLPMLMVGQVNDATPRGVADATFSASDYLDADGDGVGVVASVRRGSALLFQRIPTMTATEATPTTSPATPDEPTNANATPTQPTLFEDDGEEMAEGGGGLDVSAICKAIESGEIPIGDFEELEAAMAARRGAQTEEAMDEPEPAPIPGESMSAEVAELRGKVRGLEAKDQARDAADAEKAAEDRRTADVGEAFERLKSKPLGSHDALREELTTFHRDHGPEAFSRYVAGMEKAAGGDLPEEDDTPVDENPGGAPKEALAFSKHGMKAVDQATSFYRQWEQLSRAGGTRLDAKTYVQINMSRTAGLDA